jgi:hypothetical protein
MRLTIRGNERQGRDILRERRMGEGKVREGKGEAGG